MDKYLIEFLGTAFFLFVIISTENALAIGAALAIAIIIGGRISGGHFNPAVSVMMTAAGKMPVYELLPFVIAQVLGGLVALEIFKNL